MCAETNVFINLVFGNSAALGDSQVKDSIWHEALPVKWVNRIISL